jgi:hypothetical protein
MRLSWCRHRAGDSAAARRPQPLDGVCADRGRGPALNWIPNAAGMDVKQLLSIVILALGCGQTRYLCSGPQRRPNLDVTLNALGGPMVISPRLGSKDSLIGLVLDSARRTPLPRVQVRFLIDTLHYAVTDSNGRFRLPLPQGDPSVIDIRVIGFMSRRDTIDAARIQGREVEFTLLDAYARGDIEAIEVCGPARR